MVKTKNNKGKAKPKSKRAANRTTMLMSPRRDVRISEHVAMVTDPCNSVIGQTAYRGKDGFVNRFTEIRSSGGSGATCSLIAYWPRYNRVFQNNFATDTAPFSINFYDATYGSAGPGGVFLGANAGVTRPVGACITSSYVGTELNRAGYVSSGVVPYSTLTGTVTLDKIRQLCQRWQRTPDHQVETKWIPSPGDEDYVQIPSSLPADVTDDNVIIHIIAGFPVDTASFYHRLTNIFEWQPYYGLGISCPTPNTPDTPGGLERVRTVLSQMGNWWQEATTTAATALRVGTRAYASGRALAVASSRALPLLMAA